MVGRCILPTLDLAQGIPAVPAREPACPLSLSGGGVIMQKAPSSVGGGQGVVGGCASLRPFLMCIMTWLS